MARRARRARRIRIITGVTAAAAASALLLSGCTTQQGPSTVPITVGERPPSDAVSLYTDRDAAVTEALKQLPSLIQEGMAASGVPGLSVAVVSKGEVAYSGAFGVKDVTTGDPVDVDTVFQIASMSKPLSGTIVAKQVSDGELTWRTPVQTLLPDFTMKDPYVTTNGQVADYLSHRTGIPTGGGDDLEDLGFDRDYILSKLDQIPLSDFRSTYNYSNFGITVGAEAAAAAHGESWEKTAQDLLFGPLGMTSTTTAHADFLAAPDHATMHTRVEPGKFEALEERDADAEAPAGGVASTVGDISKWMELMLADGELDGQPYIDPAALLPMISAQQINSPPSSPEDRPGHYGYGINVGSTVAGRTTLSHSGAFYLGAATATTMVPSLDLGIVVLTNGSPVGLPEAITSQFLDLVQYGHLTHDWVPLMDARFQGFYAPAGDLAGETAPSGAAAAGPLQDYAGTYTSPYFGTLTVTVDGDHLVGALGPDGGYTFPMSTWDGDTFSFVPTGEDAPVGSLSSAAFVRTGGAVGQVTLQYFDKFGLGTFTRAG